MYLKSTKYMYTIDVHTVVHNDAANCLTALQQSTITDCSAAFLSYIYIHL